MSDGRDDGRGGTLRHRPPRQYLHSEPQGRLAARVATSREARRRRLGLMICGALSAVVLIVAGGAWGLTGYINDTIKRVDAGTSDSGTTGPLNILVAGVDQRTGLTHHQEVVLHVGDDVSTNSDTLMLVHIPANHQTVQVVSLPRDSWVSIPGFGMNKINAAYGLGGPKLVVQTVEADTGLTINDFIQVNFLGFVRVIDALGGVNICLPFAVDDSDSGLHLSKGLHHVSGITALEYARDRHSFATSDLARIQDQQHLLSSMLTEAISSGTLANPVKLDRFLHAALAAIKVDQGLNVAALADQMRGVSPSDVRFMTVPLSNYNYQTPTGELAVLWNASESRALFNELRHDQPATKPTPRHARPSSPKLRRSQVPLQVWNGTLIGGLSASTGTDLSQLGFPVKSGLTWPVHDVSQTVIQYPPGDVAGARLVRKVMPGATLQQVKGLAKVRVLLGTTGYSVTSGTGTPNPSASSTGVPSATAAQDACH